MTLSTLTPEQKRIAIAERCGWTGPYATEWLREYDKEGCDVLGLVPLSSPASIREVVLFAFSNATAAQRADAFLIATGKATI